MRIFNKFVESKKEPSNKNDIWFDGSVFKIYKEEEWRTITLTKEAIDRIVEYAKSLDIYVMVNELPDSGEEGKIYVLQTIVGDYSVELSEYVWENDSWKLVDNFNSVSLVLDNELSETSHNAVANHVITEALKNKVDKSKLESLCPEEIFVFPEELLEGAKRVEYEGDYLYLKYADYGISKEQVESYYGCPYSEVYDKVSKAKMLSCTRGSSYLIPTITANKTDSFFAAFTSSVGTRTIEYHFGIFEEEDEGIVFILREMPHRLQQSTVFEELEKKANKDELATPDWNVNEGEEGYIKGRTHYINDGITWQSAKKIDEHTASLYYTYNNDSIVSFNYGIVGIAYHEVAKGSDLIGRKFWDPEGLYDFEFFENEDEQLICVRSFGVGIDVILNSPTINLRVSEDVEDVHQLPLAYIPSFIARKNYVDERIEEVETFIEDLQNTKIEKENDDYYPKMAVGLADNLAGVDVVDSEINFRRSGGGAITDGVARIESIKGNSVVWNQRWSLGVRQGVIDNTDGASPKYASLGFMPWYTTAINGHKILTIANDKEGVIDQVYWNDQVQNDVRGGAIYEAKTLQTTGSSLTARCPANTIANYDVTIQLYDLTQMFGSGNEPTTIEEFYARIPMGVDLNAYNEGEVIHMDVQSIESVGVNQWDEEWENGYYDANGQELDSSNMIRSKNYIPILPNTSYFFTVKTDSPTGISLNLFFYDINKNFISSINKINIAYTTPSNAAYLRFRESTSYGNTYLNNICINLSDASINGKYFPYIKRVEDLSIIRKYFPQGMRSAGSAHDEIRYNKASGKWEKVVRIAEVDMGSLEWLSYQPNGTFNVFYTGANPFPAAYSNFGKNVVSQRYVAVNKGAVDFIDRECRLFFQSDAIYPRFYIRDDAYTDTASFKAAMQGVILYYELAEPIITELDEADQFKDLDYQVWNAGTEKAIAEGKSAPLAADNTYGFNAIGKIKELESLVAALRAKVGI